MLSACYLGIDIGSLTVKAVLLDDEAHVLAHDVAPAGYGGQDAARALVTHLWCWVEARGIEPTDLAYSVVTGYGRARFVANEEISEISCHARGAFFLYPAARTVIDIGGQDSKAIRLDASGRVEDFFMNDKCAAGTGRFLEVMASALGVPVPELGGLALRSSHPVSISSTCTVFAESEAISHISRGTTREDVAAGLHRAIASRVLGLAAHIGLEREIVLTGGVAWNAGVVAALMEQSGCPFTVPADPQTIGALGAALYALRKGRG